jgi:uncharacterized protein (TIGR02246 family)
MFPSGLLQEVLWFNHGGGNFMQRICLLLVLTITLAASGQEKPETAIRQLLSEQTKAWNRGDIDTFMKSYEDSPNTTFVGQTVQYGYATIRGRYAKLYPTPAGMGKLTFSSLAVRVLDPSYAVATGNFHLERTAAGGGNADGIFSLVLKQDPQGWKIILDHSNRTN